jgi:hypothetical protein
MINALQKNLKKPLSFGHNKVRNPEISIGKKKKKNPLNNHHPPFGPATTKILKTNNTQKYCSPPLHSVLAMQNFQLPKTSTQNRKHPKIIPLSSMTF